MVFSPVKELCKDNPVLPSQPGRLSPLNVIVPVPELHVIVLQPQVREAQSVGGDTPGSQCGPGWPSFIACFHFTLRESSPFEKETLPEEEAVDGIVKSGSYSTVSDVLQGPRNVDVPGRLADHTQLAAFLLEGVDGSSSEDWSLSLLISGAAYRLVTMSELEGLWEPISLQTDAPSY